ncbi:MAG: hypothetical protein ABR881_12680, partial [Candidatus Sulfotelmatobacter sp.]
MKSIEPLPDAESRPELEMPPCGRICEDRICEDHIREARLIQSSLIPTATLRDQSIEIAFRFTPQKHKLSERWHELQPEFGSLLEEQLDLLVAVSLVVALHPF